MAQEGGESLRAAEGGQQQVCRRIIAQGNGGGAQFAHGQPSGKVFLRHRRIFHQILLPVVDPAIELFFTGIDARQDRAAEQHFKGAHHRESFVRAIAGQQLAGS